jgi:hypothetical protein
MTLADGHSAARSQPAPLPRSTPACSWGPVVTRRESGPHAHRGEDALDSRAARSCLGGGRPNSGCRRPLALRGRVYATRRRRTRWSRASTARPSPVGSHKPPVRAGAVISLARQTLELPAAIGVDHRRGFFPADQSTPAARGPLLRFGGAYPEIVRRRLSRAPAPLAPRRSRTALDQVFAASSPSSSLSEAPCSLSCSSAAASTSSRRRASPSRLTSRSSRSGTANRVACAGHRRLRLISRLTRAEGRIPFRPSEGSGKWGRSPLTR